MRSALYRPLLMLLLGLAVAAQSRAETLVTLLLDDSYPPYSFQRDGEASGIYADILRAAEPLLPGYRLKLKPLPWRRALAEIEAGRELAVVPPYYRPQERPWIGPYSVPMLEERLAVFCRQGVFKDNPRLRWPEDYRGLRFGNNMGFLLGGQPFWSAVQLGLIHVEEAPGNRANLLKLVHQRIDCYLNDRLSVLSELARMRQEGLYDPGKHQLVVEGPSVSVENGHVGFSNRSAERFPFKQDFASRLDAALIQ
ncbi:MAG TPA: transporter substrate-binding domain-containing protein, partial [Pseudomonas sp.]|nr:transporter substrate-binding domain-containing protein [Pseudomonas sp.]